MCLIFVGQGYPRKLFNLEHFLIYGSNIAQNLMSMYPCSAVHTYHKDKMIIVMGLVW